MYFGKLHRRKIASTAKFRSCAGFRTPARRALHALMRPASEKRQGTKSRWVEHPAWQRAAMGIWAGRGCQCDLMAAVWMIALGQKIAESTLNWGDVRCASGFGVGLRAGVARRCKRERCRARASQNGGGRCGG